MARTVLERPDAVRALAEVFRRHGFASASLSVIQQESGIGRGSLYHFFPAGKADMARAVLDEVRRWFDEHVFRVLAEGADPAGAVSATTRVVEEYFRSRERVCLFAAVTLGAERGPFTADVHRYFADWVEALAGALRRGGVAGPTATEEALDAVAAIQGALVLGRALDDDAVPAGVLARTDRRLQAVLAG